MMTRDQAIAARKRVREWEARQLEALYQSILIPCFGGCMCRLHNCRVNWESGWIESTPSKHKRLAELAALFKYEQRRIWDTATRLQKDFARYL